MIQTRNILETDYPAVTALWGKLHAEAIPDSFVKNCWPNVPADPMLAHLVERYDWSIVEVTNPQSAIPMARVRNPQSLLGFTFWKIDPEGNAFVRAIAAQDEAPYLHLVVASVEASQTEAYGMLARNRPERRWFENIGATFAPVGFAPMTPAEEKRHVARAEKLAARTPTQDKVIVPVSLLPAIRARLEELV